MRGQPVLLYLFAEGASAEAIQDAFGRHRVHVDFPDAPPAWTRRFPGLTIEVQTLYGEYAGWVGSNSASQEKLAASRKLEREQNLRAYHEVLTELSRFGAITLVLSTKPEPARRTIALQLGNLTSDVLAEVPTDVPVCIAGVGKRI